MTRSISNIVKCPQLLPNCSAELCYFGYGESLFKILYVCEENIAFKNAPTWHLKKMTAIIGRPVSLTNLHKKYLHCLKICMSYGRWIVGVLVKVWVTKSFLSYCKTTDFLSVGTLSLEKAGVHPASFWIMYHSVFMNFICYTNAIFPCKCQVHYREVCDHALYSVKHSPTILKLS